MRIGAIAVTSLLLLAGCSGLLDEFRRPDLPVKQTPVVEGGWNRDRNFVVLVDTVAPHAVRIVANGPERIVVDGLSSMGAPVEVALPDGTWTITYYVDDFKWTTLRDVRIDATLPTVDGLEHIGEAEDREFLLGADAIVEPGATVQVFVLDGPRRTLIAEALPVPLSGLADGLHLYQVVVRDAAGNVNPINVQVRAGDAKALPPGTLDFGIVARYSNTARIWDISDLDAYASPAAAQAAVGGGWMGSGYGTTPTAPAVQQVVADVLTDEDTTAEIAWTLFRWMYDALEYDDLRLESTTLMLPTQVIEDSEHPDVDRDAGDDGLADDGTGNGVAGGVCRDLAATFVSLLRAAGVPARLVSGYLAGEVNGFHAWAEFYGGDVDGNPGPWVPVDVSSVDGRWEDDGGAVTKGFATSMLAFGIQHADYLALRAMPEELPGWSSALKTSYSFPPSSGEPDIRFRKDVAIDGAPQTGALCFSEDRSRSITSGSCSGLYFPDYVLFTQRTIDYGIEVMSAGPGTTIDIEIAYPFQGTVHPDHVAFSVYGADYEVDEADGKVSARIAS